MGPVWIPGGLARYECIHAGCLHDFAFAESVNCAVKASALGSRNCFRRNSYEERMDMDLQNGDFQLLTGWVVLGLLVLFYGGTFVMSLSIGKKKENADGYMTAGNKIGFGVSAASMTATWIWAASMYASATSGYTYGISGPIHYGLWGALMILFIYPFGRRIRAVAPKAHTLAEVMYARHGRSSQLMLAGSNILGSVISLTSNFIAGGALIALLSPFSFGQGILAVAAGVLLTPCGPVSGPPC